MRRHVVTALVLSGVILTAGQAFTWITARNFLGENSEAIALRVMNVLFGVVLIYYANAAPKMLAPLSKRRCEPAAVQSIQRFSGWTLVLAGLAYCIIWLGAPLEVATVASTLAVASGLAIVLTRCLVLRLRPKQTRTGT